MDIARTKVSSSGWNSRVNLAIAATCALLVVLGIVVGNLGIRRIFLGAPAEYVRNGLIVDAAHLQYKNAPAPAAIESVREMLVRLERCGRADRSLYPCDGILLVRTHAMLGNLFAEVGDDRAAEQEMSQARSGCRGIVRRECSEDELHKLLGPDVESRRRDKGE